MEQTLTTESAYAALRDAPMIGITSRGELPKSAGLYGAWADGVLLYVGIAVNIHSRWRSHHRFGSISTEYPGACLSWLPVEGSMARELEIGVIHEYKPRFNKTGNPDCEEEGPRDMIFARVDPAISTALAEYARRHDRSPSYMVRNIIINFLHDKGFLPKGIDVRAHPLP